MPIFTCGLHQYEQTVHFARNRCSLCPEYPEELEDYREWNEEEAIYRIRGLIRRLNKEGFSELFLAKANLKNVNLSTSNLKRADLSEANLENAKLLNTDIEFANLTRTNFKGADLTKANMEGVKSSKANFEGADLRGVCLKEADLTDAILTGANLDFADLEGAILNGAKLKDTCLAGANIKGVSLVDTNLEEALYTEINFNELKGGKEHSGGVRERFHIVLEPSSESNASLVNQKQELSIKEVDIKVPFGDREPIIINYLDRKVVIDGIEYEVDWAGITDTINDSDNYEE